MDGLLEGDGIGWGLEGNFRDFCDFGLSLFRQGLGFGGLKRMWFLFRFMRDVKD
jgi:hypothetical protein